MEKNKYTLYSIIILLVIFVPCSIYGTYMHIKTTANLKHEFKFNNKLYFYENDSLLGTYECKSSKCDYATFSNNNLKASILNSKYTFIMDDNHIYLYDVSRKESLAEYQEIQNIAESIFRVRQDKLWGAISITNTVTPILANNFDSIEFKNNKFIVSTNNTWSIYQGQQELFSNELSIKDFNEEFIIVTDGTSDKLYDFNKAQYLETVSNKTLSFAEDLILLRRFSNYYVYQIKKSEEITSPSIIDNFSYMGNEQITHKKTEEGNIEFYAGEELLKTVDLSVQENS